MTTPTPGTERDDKGEAPGDKLVPEWRVDSDDQILLAGLAVFVAMLLALGWNLWRDGDGDITAVASTAIDELDSSGPDAATGLAPAAPDNDGSDDGDSDDEAASPTTTTTPASSTTTTEEPTTTVADPVIGDVQAAVDPLAGSITGGNEGGTAVLTGFVANEIESQEAEAAAAAVEGIESVDNRLAILEPDVRAALEAAGVKGATAVGVGTEITVSGTIDTEDIRQSTLDAAAAVSGVTSIVDDRLNVSVTADLNALPQVQFATGSAEILAVSFPDLDAAASLLTAADQDVSIEVQGYTDVRGDEQSNQELSQNRADAIRQYLIDAGVEAEMLTAVGYGETRQFAEGDTAADYQANRLVRFQQTG